MRIRSKLILAAFVALEIIGMAQDVSAVVGRPATPGSVAGVARRTSRRTPGYRY